MKYIFCVLNLTICCSVYGQSNINSSASDIADNQTNESSAATYPNTNIGKGIFVVHVSLGHMPHSNSLADYFKAPIIGGGTMSFDLFSPNKSAFSLFLMGTGGELKKDITLDEKRKWAIEDSVHFWSYGISAGYSFLNTLRWRFTAWGGTVLSHSKLTSLSDSDKLRTGPKLSPIIGVNFSFRFINPERYKSISGAASCGGINIRMSYIPFAVYKKGNPFSGGIWYLTFGANLEMFQAF